MKSAPMKWIDRIIIAWMAVVAVAAAVATHLAVAAIAATFAILFWRLSRSEREAAYQKRRADLLEALLSMELGDALHTAFREWLDRGQR